MFIQSRDMTVPPEGLTAQRFFWEMQEVSAEQCVTLGQSADDLAARGVMWAVIRYRVELTRWPEPEERLRFTTWPGLTRHAMCARYYRVFGADGAALGEGASYWVVMDRKSRRMVEPAEHGVVIEPLTTGDEPRLPGAIRRLDTERERPFTVPERYLDANGHMNNTAYFDLAEQVAGTDARRQGLRSAQVEYISEALCGEELRLRWGFDGEKYAVAGDSASGSVFRMLLAYFR